MKSCLHVGLFGILSTSLCALSQSYVIQVLLESLPHLDRMFPACLPPAHSPLCGRSNSVFSSSHGLFLLLLSPINTVSDYPQINLSRSDEISQTWSNINKTKHKTMRF